MAALWPGAICRSREGREFLLLEQRGERWDATSYPAGASAATVWLPASEFEPVGEDLASARVLRMRRRSLEAAGRCGRRPERPIRTAMVLCAGLGLRLRPLTMKFPKPAVPFFGGPLVRYSFALLKNAGIERVVINTHHLPEVMERAAREEAERQGLALSISNEPEIQGTAGGLRDARRFLEGEPFVVVNGDAFMSLDLADLVARHQAAGALATLGVVPMPPDEKFNAVEARPDGAVRRIRGIGESEPNLVPWHFVGVQVIEPELLDHIPGPGAMDTNSDVYPRLIAQGRLVQAAPVNLGAWADMGTPRRYLQACEEMLSGLCDLSALGADAPLPVGEDERLRALPPSARAVVDPSARVAPGAIVEGSQIGPDAVVGEEAVVRGSAVLPGTRIAPGERVEGVIACGDLRLA
ncbi:MAG: sugar phosphate nucleotidyltransferase [Myxococcales bacterium]